MVGTMAPSGLEGFSSDDLRSVESLRIAKSTQLGNGGRERWLELRRSADVERPKSLGQGPDWTDERGIDRVGKEGGAGRSVDYHCTARRSMAALASPLSQAESMRREWTD